MRYLIVLLFPTLLFAQTDIVGDFRIPEVSVDNRILVTSLGGFDMQAPNCEVDGAKVQCLFDYIGKTFDQGFPPTLTQRPRDVWELTAEPINPIYDSPLSNFTLVIEQLMVIDVVLIDVGSAYAAVCQVSMRRIEQEVAPPIKFRFILIEFTTCDESVEIPVKEAVGFTGPDESATTRDSI